MSWQLWLTSPLTGRLLRELPDVPFSWSLSLRSQRIGSDPQGIAADTATSLSFPWSAFDDRWDKADVLMPGKYWILALQDGAPRIWCELGDTTNDDENISVELTSISTVLARLMLVREAAVQAQLQGDITAIAKSTWYDAGYLLGVIGKHELQAVQDKPQALPPIRYPDDVSYTDDSAHQRTVNGFDLQNINLQTLLDNLSNVTNGPDIALRPEMVDERTVRFAYYYGRPSIAQRIIWGLEWAAGQAGGQVSKITMKRSASAIADRVYATGAGQDQATLVAVAQSQTPAAGRLFREAAISSTSSDQQTTLQSYADAQLAASQDVLAQLQVDIVDGSVPISNIQPGDQARLTLTGYPNLPDGTYNSRILQMDGTSTGPTTLTMAVMNARTMETL